MLQAHKILLQDLFLLDGLQLKTGFTDQHVRQGQCQFASTGQRLKLSHELGKSGAIAVVKEIPAGNAHQVVKDGLEAA